MTSAGVLRRVVQNRRRQPAELQQGDSGPECHHSWQAGRPERASRRQPPQPLLGCASSASPMLWVEIESDMLPVSTSAVILPVADRTMRKRYRRRLARRPRAKLRRPATQGWPLGTRSMGTSGIRSMCISAAQQPYCPQTNWRARYNPGSKFRFEDQLDAVSFTDNSRFFVSRVLGRSERPIRRTPPA